MPPPPIAGQDNEGSRMGIDSETGAYRFSWWGVSGRTYFIQHTEELGFPTFWNFLPVIEQGAEAPIEYGFLVSGSPPRFFLRLRHTDEPTDDPYAADFDGDGIPNGWEIEHGLNPFDETDAALITNGLTNLEIYQASQGIGADPSTATPVGLLVYTP